MPGLRGAITLLGASVLAVACGGGSPLDNPPNVVNPPGGGGQSLSFVYFQKCVNPVLIAQLALPTGGSGSCASSGCHDNVNGTGGAFRMTGSAATVADLSDAAAVRLTEMYRNFFSAQGSSVIGSPTTSRLLTKPLVQGVLHGGGVIFPNPDTPEARLLAYWISRPMPQGQDEFSSAAAAMFTPADPATGSCNTQ